jgi:hypothetical protein
MFPQGGPGVALLFLRLAVAAILPIDVLALANYYGASSVLLHDAIILVICLLSLSLIVGFLTPFIAVIVCLVAGVNLLHGSHSEDLIHLLRLIVAAALALLGPGAYSVDAKLFGRRVTYVSPRKDKTSF